MWDSRRNCKLLAATDHCRAGSQTSENTFLYILVDLWGIFQEGSDVGLKDSYLLNPMLRIQADAGSYIFVGNICHQLNHTGSQTVCSKSSEPIFAKARVEDTENNGRHGSDLLAHGHCENSSISV